MEACSQSLAFLPEFDNMVSFSSLVSETGLSNETLETARTLDAVFDGASKNVNRTNNYLQVKVFISGVNNDFFSDSVL